MQKLESYKVRGSNYKRKAKTLYRIQKILFKRWKQNRGQELMLAREGNLLHRLKQNNSTLATAVLDYKAKLSGFDQVGSGLFGRVKQYQGNCMPGLELDSSCQVTSLKTEIRVRELSQISDSYVYYDFADEPIAVLETDSDGYYFLDLEPGVYSVFVQDGEREYCNSFDVEGFACKIEITEAEKLEYDLSIDHAFW